MKKISRQRLLTQKTFTGEAKKNPLIDIFKSRNYDDAPKSDVNICPNIFPRNLQRQSLDIQHPKAVSNCIFHISKRYKTQKQTVNEINLWELNSIAKSSLADNHLNFLLYHQPESWINIIYDEVFMNINETKNVCAP